MHTTISFLLRLLSRTGIPRIIIPDRDPKFTSEFWTGLQKMLGTKLSFSTADPPETDGLAESMIQTLEDMIRSFCAYAFEFKENDGHKHDWVSLMPILEIAYSTSVHSTAGPTPITLERGWNPNVPQHMLNNNITNIQPTTLSYAFLLDKARKMQNNA